MNMKLYLGAVKLVGAFFAFLGFFFAGVASTLPDALLFGLWFIVGILGFSLYSMGAHRWFSTIPLGELMRRVRKLQQEERTLQRGRGE